MKRLLTGLLLGAATLAAQADAVDALREFTRDVKSGRAAFLEIEMLVQILPRQ